MLSEINIPVQVTFVLEPVFVYPVLQVQTTAKFDLSCEQIALQSHPPFFTSQLSKKEIYKNELDELIISKSVLTFADYIRR